MAILVLLHLIQIIFVSDRDNEIIFFGWLTEIETPITEIFQWPRNNKG